MDNTPDILVTVIPFVEALKDLEVPYHIGGSVASSLYGLPRLTIDVDIIADVLQGHDSKQTRMVQDGWRSI